MMLQVKKYLGLWSNDLKYSNDLIVTLEGIYYERAFTQDVLGDYTFTDLFLI